MVVVLVSDGALGEHQFSPPTGKGIEHLLLFGTGLEDQAEGHLDLVASTKKQE
jgi:hypothetical protein